MFNGFWLGQFRTSLLLEGGMEDWGGPPFRFELMWLSDKGFKDSVKNWWGSVSIRGLMHTNILKS